MRKKEEKGGEIERKWKRGSGKEEVKNGRDMYCRQEVEKNK